VSRIVIHPLFAAILSLAGVSGAGAPALAGTQYKETIRTEFAPKVRAWAQSPDVILAVRRQNEVHAGLSDAAIAKLDRKWREETQSPARPMIDTVLGNALSDYLRQVQDKAQGFYTEIFVMDNRGLNVGQSNLTSDYWQGDEAKWQQTYQAGAGSILIDDVEFDESTQAFQSQLSLPVVDPDTSEVIGAVTVGVNVGLFE